MYKIRSKSTPSAPSLPRRKPQIVCRSSTVPVEYGLDPNISSIFVERGLRPCTTWSGASNQNNNRVIKRTSSDGYHFLRKRSAEEQEQISRARAQELCSLYEMSDRKATGLIKMTHFEHAVLQVPSLSAGMTGKEAATLFAKKQANKRLGAQPDPLLTQHERVQHERKEECARRKAEMDVLLSPAGQLSRAPFALLIQPRSNSSAYSKQQPQPVASGHSKKATTLTIDTTKLKSALGREVHLSTPGNFSVEETVVETPSPIGYRASNGQLYEVPNLC
jgi:hypothetical protein